MHFAVPLHNVRKLFVVYKMDTLPRVWTDSLKSQHKLIKQRKDPPINQSFDLINNQSINQSRERERRQRLTLVSKNSEYALPNVPTGKDFKYVKSSVLELISGRCLNKSHKYTKMDHGAERKNK